MLPTSLEILDISGGDTYYDRSDHHKFTGGIPPKWGALTNLKQLNMARCGLDGAFCSSRTELHRLASSLTLSCTGVIPAELGQLVNLVRLDLNRNQLSGERSESVLSGFMFC